MQIEHGLGQQDNDQHMAEHAQMQSVRASPIKLSLRRHHMALAKCATLSASAILSTISMPVLLAKGCANTERCCQAACSRTALATPGHDGGGACPQRLLHGEHAARHSVVHVGQQHDFEEHCACKRHGGQQV